MKKNKKKFVIILIILFLIAGSVVGIVKYKQHKEYKKTHYRNSEISEKKARELINELMNIGDIKYDLIYLADVESSYRLSLFQTVMTIRIKKDDEEKLIKKAKDNGFFLQPITEQTERNTQDIYMIQKKNKRIQHDVVYDGAGLVTMHFWIEKEYENEADVSIHYGEFEY